MKVLILGLLLFCFFPPQIKSQSSHHPKRNNYVKLLSGSEVIGEGILYELTDSAFIVYDDTRISRHDTIMDKSLLKSFSFHQVQLIKVNPGSALGSLCIGGFIGGATGSFVGFGIANAGTSDETSMERSHDQLVGFIVGFIIGGIAGAIPGYILGNKQREQVSINYDYSTFISEKDNLKPFCFRK
jgi:hypothetical protein